MANYTVKIVQVLRIEREAVVVVDADSEADAVEAASEGAAPSSGWTIRHETLENEDYEEPTAMGDLVTLRFRPQAWVLNNAVAADPEGATEFFVPKAKLLEIFETEQEFNDRDGDRDDLRFEGTAPDWIRNWSGPFEIDLQNEGVWDEEPENV